MKPKNHSQFVAFFLTLSAIPAVAGDATWNNGTASWSSAAQWTSTPVGNYPKNGNAGQSWNATINGGSAALDVENITIQQFTLTGGAVTGAFNLTASGPLTWTNGSMSGAGVTHANGGILISGYYASPTLSGRTLNNAAGQTASLSGINASFYLGSAAVFNNSGIFLAENDGNLTNAGGAASTFNNAGTFTRDIGTGTFSINLNGVFNNTGTVNVKTGTLALNTAVAQYSGNALTGGIWNVFANSILNLPTTGAGIITNQADITLSGSSSVFRAGAASATLDSILTANSGALRLLANRSYSAASAFSNGGVLQLGGGIFTAPTLANTATGEVFGFGEVSVRPTNSGLIRSAGGTLSFSNGIQGGSGTVQIDADSTLDLSGGASGSSADLLIHHGTTPGSLKLGSNHFTVKVDYTNAAFGTGNGFTPRANVAGAGQILASGNVAQTLTGNVTGGTGASPVMTFGKVRVGSAVTQNYKINNIGTTGSSLRGATQTSVNGGSLNDSRLSGAGVVAGNFGPIIPGGNSGNLTVTFTATTAGALANQKVHVLNNFDNVANQTLAITGAAYRFASPNNLAASPIAFGNRHVGAAAPTQLLTVTNQAANDSFSESLNASIGSATGGVTTNGGSISGLSPGSSNGSALSIGISTATAGLKNGSATLALTSNGTGSSGLGLTPLASQIINVTGKVYRLAQPSIVGGTSLDFGIVHVGESAAKTVSVKNNTAADGYSESLNASFSASSGDTVGSGGFTALAPGATNAAPQVTLDTVTAGAKAGTATLALVSNGSGSSGLPNSPLASQVITATGQVNHYASPEFPLVSGPVTVTGSGSAYTVDFGRRTIGEVVPAAILRLTNNAAAPADTLAGSFATAAPTFTLTGLGAFTGIAAGQSQGGMSMVLKTDALGTYTQTITLNGLSQNSGGFSGALDPIVITLKAEVAEAPTLTIQLTSTDTLLSWPLAEQSWILKRSDNLTNWTLVTEPVVDTATEHTVTLPLTADPKWFFRLEK